MSALAFAALIGLIAWMGAADIGVAPGSPDSDEAGFQSAATLFKHPVHWQTTALLTCTAALLLWGLYAAGVWHGPDRAPAACARVQTAS